MLDELFLVGFMVLSQINQILLLQMAPMRNSDVFQGTFEDLINFEECNYILSPYRQGNSINPFLN